VIKHDITAAPLVVGFRQTDEKVRTIYTAMFYPPPELAVPNWPPYEGHWPLPADIVPAPARE